MSVAGIAKGKALETWIYHNGMGMTAFLQKSPFKKS